MCPSPFNDMVDMMAFLEATKYFKKVPSTVKVINTGGDGLGEITFKLTR